MNIKELKELIADLPDDAPILIEASNKGLEVEACITYVNKRVAPGCYDLFTQSKAPALLVG